jgi:SAM-dependent methyltransferase
LRRCGPCGPKSEPEFALRQVAQLRYPADLRFAQEFVTAAAVKNGRPPGPHWHRLFRGHLPHVSMTASIAWVGEVRRLELLRLRDYLPATGKVLDFGAGTGQQALLLKEFGLDVQAIDVASSPHLESRVFDVTTYDGCSLPFPDAHFDVVMSSNVLEHVQNLPNALRELSRVLKPGATMLHVLPSSSWRLWSTLAEFVVAPIAAFLAVVRGPRGVWVGMARWRWTAAQLIAALRPLRFRPHGVDRCALTELWSFSRLAWLRRFAVNDYSVLRIEPLKLWYTGEMVLGPRLSLVYRTRLAAWLGSSTVLYVIHAKSGDLHA